MKTLTETLSGGIRIDALLLTRAINVLSNSTTELAGGKNDPGSERFRHVWNCAGVAMRFKFPGIGSIGSEMSYLDNSTIFVVQVDLLVRW